MKIFVVGANGFIGRRLAAVLSDAGHDVVRGVRDVGAARGLSFVAVDFVRDQDAGDWLPRLAGVDAVINLVGIFRESGSQTFASVHERAPRALFTACATTGVRKVVQLSALGADQHARSRYHLSKRRADEFLRTLPLDWVIVQPSLVFGIGGTSARLFLSLASLPIIPLPGRGDQPVQPIHIDDLCTAVLHIIERDDYRHRSVPAVGPHAVSFREMIARLRTQLALAPARFVDIPMRLVRYVAKLAGRVPGSLIDAEAIAMLERGNVAGAGPITELLGRAPRSLQRFIAPDEARMLSAVAKGRWLLPMLRASVGLLWIATGIISLGVYPVEESYALLARVGVIGALAPFALYGAAILDLALGIAVFTLRRRRVLWRAQIGLILVYSIVIAWKLPEFWLHPFAPLLKNIPLIAAIVLLHELDNEA
jgi:uncharacterized protein YbjT (DUF2867 family)